MGDREACAKYGKPACYGANQDRSESRGRERSGYSGLYCRSGRGDTRAVRAGICNSAKATSLEPSTSDSETIHAAMESGNATATIDLNGNSSVYISYTLEDGRRCRRIPPFVTSSCSQAKIQGEYGLKVNGDKLTVTFEKGVQEMTLKIGGKEYRITREAAAPVSSVPAPGSSVPAPEPATSITPSSCNPPAAPAPVTAASPSPSTPSSTSTPTPTPSPTPATTPSETPAPPTRASTLAFISDALTTVSPAVRSAFKRITSSDLLPSAATTFGDPVGLKTTSSNSAGETITAYSFIRPAPKNEGGQYILQVTKDSTPNPLRDAAVSVYEENLRGLDSIIFNPLSPLLKPVEVNGTTYTKAQVRPDGSVLLGGEDVSSGFAVLRPNRGRQDSAVNWDVVKINSNFEVVKSNGGPPRKDKGLTDSNNLRHDADELIRLVTEGALTLDNDGKLIPRPSNQSSGGISSPSFTLPPDVSRIGAEMLGAIDRMQDNKFFDLLDRYAPPKTDPRSFQALSSLITTADPVKLAKSIPSEIREAVIDKFLSYLPTETNTELNPAKLKTHLHTLSSEHSRWISSYNSAGINVALSSVFRLEMQNPGAISLAKLYWATISDTPWDSMIKDLLPEAKNRAKLAWVALGSKPTQSKVIPAPDNLEFDLTPTSKNGLRDAAGVRVGSLDDDRGYWSVIRSWEGKPTVLQIVDYKNASGSGRATKQDLATVLAAYRVNTSEGNLMFNLFHHLPEDDQATEVSTPFTKAQIRSDGSVLLADASETTFRIIKPKRRTGDNNQPTDFIDWSSEDVTYSSEHGVQKKTTTSAASATPAQTSTHRHNPFSPQQPKTSMTA